MIACPPINTITTANILLSSSDYSTASNINFVSFYGRLLRLSFFIAADPEGPGCCALLLALVSILLIIATLPFSLCMCIKVRALVKKSWNGRTEEEAAIVV